MLKSCENIQQITYISDNPIIRMCLSTFLKSVVKYIISINAVDKLGLDAGCGEGHLLNYLYCQKVIGRLNAIDTNINRLHFARKNYPWFDYQLANLCHIPFKDATFDYIISTEVFEHLPHPKQALIELKRIAKPDGYIIISVPFEPFFHWGNLLRGKYWLRGGYTPNHCNFWHRHQFKEFLAPFVEIDVEFGVQTFPWLLYGCRFKK